MEQLTLLETPPLCNRCNAEHDGKRCANCGGQEYRLTGVVGQRVRAEGKIKPKRKRRQ